MLIEIAIIIGCVSAFVGFLVFRFLSSREYSQDINERYQAFADALEQAEEWHEIIEAESNRLLTEHLVYVRDMTQLEELFSYPAIWENTDEN